MEKFNEAYLGILNESSMEKNIGEVAKELALNPPFESANGVMLANGRKYSERLYDSTERQFFCEYFTDRKSGEEKLFRFFVEENSFGNRWLKMTRSSRGQMEGCIIRREVRRKAEFR